MRALRTAILLSLAALTLPPAAEAQDGGGAAEALAAPSPSGDQGPGDPAPAHPPPEATQPPAGATVPQPPPGYGDYGTQGGVYGQVPLPEDLEGAWQERQRLEQQIAVAREEYRSHGITWPIVMMAAGGGLAIGAGSIFMMANSELDSCLDACDETESARLVSGIFSLVGLGVAAIGIVQLIGTLNDRAPIRDRLRALERRKQELDRILQPYGGPVAGGAVVGVRASF